MKTFKDITMPLIWKGVLAGALFSFMTAWNEYILAETFLNDELSQTLPVMLKHYTSREKLEPRQNIWIRTAGPVPCGGSVAALRQGNILLAGDAAGVEGYLGTKVVG